MSELEIRNWMIPIEKMNVQPEPWIQLPSGRFIGKFELNTPACNNFEEITDFEDGIKVLQKPNSVSRSNDKQSLTSNMFHNRRRQLVTERDGKVSCDIKIDHFTNSKISKQIDVDSKKLKIHKINKNKELVSKTRQDRIATTNQSKNDRYGNNQHSNRTDMSAKNTVIFCF